MRTVIDALPLPGKVDSWDEDDVLLLMGRALQHLLTLEEPGVADVAVGCVQEDGEAFVTWYDCKELAEQLSELGMGKLAQDMHRPLQPDQIQFILLFGQRASRAVFRRIKRKDLS